MSTLTLPFAPEREDTTSGRSEPRRSISSDGGRLTLEQRLDRVWEGLSAAGAAPCPVCHGRLVMTPSGRGRCTSCGSSLS
jgi:hypothetical protein